MCIWRKTLLSLGEPSFIPVVKPHTHALYILRHCTNIFYTNNGIAKYHYYINIYKIGIRRLFQRLCASILYSFCTLSIKQVLHNETFLPF
jgi:hypothetical protein